MEVTFYIEDNKYKGDITRKQILEVVKPVTQCDHDEDFAYLHVYLDKKMNEKQPCFLGIKGVSARGFDFSYDEEKNSYCIKLQLPCSYDDFQVVFDFIKKLCVFLGNNKVVTGDGKEYSSEKDGFKGVFSFVNSIASALGKSNGQEQEVNDITYIEYYPFHKQIILSLNEMLETIKKQVNNKPVEIAGIKRVVAFNEKIIQDIINSEDPVKSFSDFFTNIQNLDAFSANQKLYRGKYIATYKLRENEATVLPFKPKLSKDAVFRGKIEDISHFEVNLIFIDGDINDEKTHHKIGSIKYPEFIEKLPKEKYKFIDANQILIEALSRQEMENLLP